MESSPAPWIQALRHSHDKLRAVTESLGADELTRPSQAKEWTIAQVLSHLGSGAEIFGLWLDAGLAGEDPPGNDKFAPIWDEWNAKSPQQAAHDALRADGGLVERIESLDDDQLANLRLAMFGMDLDAPGLLRMRLSEHALHTWDVAAAVDPAQRVQQDAVDLLIDTLGQLVAWTGKPAGEGGEIRVATTGPERQFVLRTGEPMSLAPADDAGAADLRLPAEALIRLVYGRLDPAHTPQVEPADADLDTLRKSFPGM